MYIQKIKNFYNEYVSKIDRIIIFLIIVTFLLGFIYILINLLITHYTGLDYLPSLWLLLSPVFLLLTIFAMYAKKHTPKLAFVTRTYGLYFFVVMALAILTTGIQYTPFPLIDHHLVAIDQALGFNSITVLNWTYAHPTLKHYLVIAYDLIGYQLFFVPLLIALLQEKKAVDIFFLAIIFSYLLGTTIYYFFPTAGPADVFHSWHFLTEQKDTSLKFYEVHHHLNVSTYLGGMIAFPSMHVAWAVLCAYALIDRKYLFYPVAILNIVIILSTFLLGWHYLTDVFAGLIVAILAIVIAHWILSRLKTTTQLS